MNSKSRKKKKKKNKRLKLVLVLTLIILIGAGVGIALLATGGGQVFGGYVIDDFSVPQGVSVDGIDLSGKDRQTAYATVRARGDEVLSGVSMTIVFNGQSYVFSAQELGVTTTATELAGKIKDMGAVGSYQERAAALASAASGEAAYTIELVFDEAKVKDAMADLCELYCLPAKDAVATFNPEAESKFDYTPEEAGFTVDPDELAALVMEELKAGRFGTVTAPGTVLTPKIDVATLRANTALVSTFTTKKLGNNARKSNIQKLSNMISGNCIMPGETWSINAVAGDRNDGTWAEANGITGGRYVLQAGGGVCQVSTTLYNAALRAGVTIAERTPHTIPSGYVEIGLDATINSNAQDLKLTNNGEFPIYIVSYVGDNSITCEIYGTPLDGYTLDFYSEEEEPVPFETEYFKATELPDGTPLAPGTSVIWREGRDLKKAQVYKVTKYADGHEETEKFGSVNQYRSYSQQVYYNDGDGLYVFDEVTGTFPGGGAATEYLEEGVDPAAASENLG